MLFFLLRNLSQEHAQHLPAICESLWKHCNLKLQNEIELCANVVGRAHYLIEVWQDASITLSASSNQLTTLASHKRLPMSSCYSSTAGRGVHWQRPTPGRLKGSIDASFQQSMNRICICISARDNDRASVLVKTMSFYLLCYVPVGDA